MDSIKTILGGFLHKRKLDKTLKVYEIFGVWEEAVGTKVALHSRPKRFKDGTLWIAVDNSTWMQQLSFLSEEICQKVNRALGSPMVEKIRFQLGEVGDRPRSTANDPDAPPEWTHTELDTRTRQAVDQAVAPLRDDELREGLKSLFKKNSQLLHHRAKE